MSAKDRYERAALAKEERKKRAELEGMRESLDSPNGRTLLSHITTALLSAEGKGSALARQIGRDLLAAAALANWEGLQTMRDEWEKPALGAQAPTEAEEEGEEG